jgi:hypothetical protein
MARPLFTATFWLDAAERLIRSEAQVALALFTVDGVTKGLTWTQGLVAFGAMGVYSVATSIVASNVGEPGTASVLNPAPPDTLNEPPAP